MFHATILCARNVWEPQTVDVMAVLAIACADVKVGGLGTLTGGLVRGEGIV